MNKLIPLICNPFKDYEIQNRVSVTKVMTPNQIRTYGLLNVYQFNDIISQKGSPSSFLFDTEEEAVREGKEYLGTMMKMVSNELKRLEERLSYLNEEFTNLQQHS